MSRNHSLEIQDVETIVQKKGVWRVNYSKSPKKLVLYIRNTLVFKLKILGLLHPNTSKLS
jgi:hypothetical protein